MCHEKPTMRDWWHLLPGWAVVDPERTRRAQQLLHVPLQHEIPRECSGNHTAEFVRLQSEVKNKKNARTRALVVPARSCSPGSGCVLHSLCCIYITLLIGSSHTLSTRTIMSQTEIPDLVPVEMRGRNVAGPPPFSPWHCALS